MPPPTMRDPGAGGSGVSITTDHARRLIKFPNTPSTPALQVLAERAYRARTIERRTGAQSDAAGR